MPRNWPEDQWVRSGARLASADVMNSSSATGGSELSLLAAFPRHGAAAPVTILHAAGSLADLVRLSPVIEALDRRGGVRQIVVHSAGAPANRDPSLAQPDRWLNVHAAAEGERTAQMLHGFEQVLLEDTPDVVLVCAPSTAPLACALAAAKQGLPVARLEAGLRGPVADAPRNINRVLTDRLADTLLTPTGDAAANLVDEGIPDTRISAVGNTAIDVLHRHERAARAKAVWERLA